MKRILASLTAAVLASASPAISAEVNPAHGQTIDLGALKGVAYYTVQPEGYHVVATVAGEDSKSIRFEANLSDGQSLVVTSSESGTPTKVELSRRANRVFVESVVAAH